MLDISQLVKDKIYYIKARDHFSSDDKHENECFIEFIGRFISVNEFYIKIQYVTTISQNHPGKNKSKYKDAKEYHNILLTDIIECSLLVPVN